MEQNKLRVEPLGRGYAWLDTGTHDNLLEAGNFIRTIEQRQGLQIACLEEIAFDMGFIGIDELQYSADNLGKSSYGEYVRSLIKHIKH